jgi:hypothetical protein
MTAKLEPACQDLGASLLKQYQESNVPDHIMDELRTAIARAATAKLETECKDLAASLVKQLQKDKLPDDGLRDVIALVRAAMACAAASTTTTTTTTICVALPATSSSKSDSIGDLAQESSSEVTVASGDMVSSLVASFVNGETLASENQRDS